MICNMCSFTGTLAMCGQCTRCGNGTASGCHILCNSCGTAANQCQRCGMDMAQSENPLVWRQIHLQVKAGKCGACLDWDGPDSHKFHQTLPDAAEVELRLDLVVHNFVMISFTGTGTEADNWQVEMSEPAFCSTMTARQSLCLAADRIGTGCVTLSNISSTAVSGESEGEPGQGRLEASPEEPCRLKKLTLKLTVGNPPAQI